MSGSRVVPFPMSSPVPMHTTWPMPAGGFPAGCCPPGGMDALLQCYCDIQAAKNFIGAIVLDLMKTDPAFAEAMVQAFADTGAALPLTGVTNGVAAQPGQVGEFVEFEKNVSFPVTQGFTQNVSMGVLEPGDWLAWAFVGQSVASNGMSYTLNPVPAGFSNNLSQQIAGTVTGLATVLDAPPVQALISVPSLINFSLTTNGDATGPAGTASVYFNALRVR